MTKIENNSRAGKIDLAELIALGRALAVPPLQLIFPRLPDGRVESWPHHETRSILAAQWFSGEISADAANDYLTDVEPSDVDLLQKARQLEMHRTDSIMSWATTSAGVELDEAKSSGDEAAIAAAERNLARAQAADEAKRSWVAQLMATMISRGMSVQPREGYDDIYEAAWDRVHANQKGENDGETTASATDQED